MPRKILRRLHNAASGRPHFEREDLSFEETQKLLQNLSDKNCVRGKITYYHPNPTKFLEKSITPSRAYDFISKYFGSSQIFVHKVKYNSKGSHEIYFGSKTEMHYIEISAGAIQLIDYSKKIKRLIRRGSKRANLEFLIKNP